MQSQRNTCFTLIIDKSCLDGTEVLYVPFIWEDRRNKEGIPISQKKNILMGYMK